METHARTTTVIRQHEMPAARYLSSVEIATILSLLAEVRDETQSRRSHAAACTMMANLGGSGWSVQVVDLAGDAETVRQ